MKYTFLERRKRDNLANGRVRCYYNEESKQEVVLTDSGEDVHDVFVYDAVDIDAPITRSAVVDAIIRTRYSQSEVEAIFRHHIAGASGSAAEFREFNDFAESCKVEADRILQ